MTTCRTCTPTSTSTRRNWRRWPDRPGASRRTAGVRVLGIDCGTERTGWGVIDSDGRKHRVIAHGVIRMTPRDPLESRLVENAPVPGGVVSAHAPDAPAVQEVFYSQKVQTPLKLAPQQTVSVLA